MKNESFVEVEFKELFATQRTFFTLLVQALSVLAVANITVIGYAIANKTAGMLILGAIIDIFTLFIFVMADALLFSSIYFRAISLKKEIGESDLVFFTDFLATFYHHSLPKEIEQLTEITDIRTRTKKLHRLFLPSIKRFSKRVFIFLTAAILQSLLIPVLINWFGWKLF